MVIFFASLGLPILDEGLIEVFVELPRGVVADVEQGRVGKHRARRKRRNTKSRRGGQSASVSWMRSPLWNTLNSI